MRRDEQERRNVLVTNFSPVSDDAGHVSDPHHSHHSGRQSLLRITHVHSCSSGQLQTVCQIYIPLVHQDTGQSCNKWSEEIETPKEGTNPDIRR